MFSRRKICNLRKQIQKHKWLTFVRVKILHLNLPQLVRRDQLYSSGERIKDQCILILEEGQRFYRSSRMELQIQER